MKKHIILLALLVSQSLFSNASFLTDSTTIVKNQPDSITRKVVTLLMEADEVAAAKPMSALKNYRAALTVNKAKDELWEANIRLAMGKILARLKSKDALTQLLRAEATFRKKVKPIGRAAAIEEIARVYESQGRFDEAKKNYDVLIKLHSKSGETVLAGNIASHLTDVFIKKQNYKEAFTYADIAKNAYYRVCKADSLGSIYYKIAYIKRKQNSPKQAEYYILGQALPYYRSADHLQGRLKSFDFLGSLYKEQKRYSQAKWFYLQSHNQAQLINDTTSTINSLVNLAVVKILIGDLSLAKQDIDEAGLLATGNKKYEDMMKTARAKYASLFTKITPQYIASVTVKKSKAPTKNTKKNSALPKTSALAEVNDKVK